MRESKVDEFRVLPSAILTDGLLPVFLFSVTEMSSSHRYSLPAIGSTGFRAVVDNSEDDISLSALLVGPQRFAWKQSLELLADLSRRGGALTRWTGGTVGGLILISSLAVKLDLQVVSLRFSVNTNRRDTINVAISLKHVPRPSAINLLVDVGAAAAMSIVDAVV